MILFKKNNLINKCFIYLLIHKKRELLTRNRMPITPIFILNSNFSINRLKYFLYNFTNIIVIESILVLLNKFKLKSIIFYDI